MAEQSTFTADSDGGAAGCCGTGWLHGGRRHMAALRWAAQHGCFTVVGWHLDGFFDAGVNEYQYTLTLMGWASQPIRYRGDTVENTSHALKYRHRTTCAAAALRHACHEIVLRRRTP
jgi:hypothetical protein